MAGYSTSGEGRWGAKIGNLLSDMELLFPGAGLGLVSQTCGLKSMLQINKLLLAYTIHILGLVGGTGRVDTTGLGCGLGWGLGCGPDRPDGHEVGGGWGMLTKWDLTVSTIILFLSIGLSLAPPPPSKIQPPSFYSEQVFSCSYYYSDMPTFFHFICRPYITRCIHYSKCTTLILSARTFKIVVAKWSQLNSNK